MHRIDNSKFLLYIEPNKEDKSEIPINDEITGLMAIAFMESKGGVANYSKLEEVENWKESMGYRGVHTTDCLKESDNRDYLLKNGMITNSLCVFYLQYYRDAIPESEMNKVMELINFYKK